MNANQTSQAGLTRINERINCSQTGQNSPETFIERALSEQLLLIGRVACLAMNSNNKLAEGCKVIVGFKYGAVKDMISYRYVAYMEVGH